MNQPKVSIGFPVYNGEPYLEAALDSIFAQDFEDFELVISDNCSTDRTGAICEAYAEKDQRVRYYRNKVNQGAAHNYNRVFELARAPYFKWATHDDICLPSFLSRCVETMDQAPSSVVLVYPRADFIDEEGKLIGPDPDYLECKHPQPHLRLAHVLRRLKMANAIFGLIRSETLRHTRLIDKFIASDFVLLAELAMIGQFLEVPENLFLRRDHPGGSVQANPGNFAKMAWFDPSAKPKGRFWHTHFPEWVLRNRLLMEYFRSVYRIRLGGTQKLLCYATIPSVIFGGPLRDLGGRWKRRLKGVVRSPVEA